MSNSMHRRNVLLGALAGACVASEGIDTFGNNEQSVRPTLDIHVHLFGIGEGGTGCRMSKKITDGAQFNLLMFMLGLRRSDTPLDEQYESMLTEQVKASGLSKVAILGQDANYDQHGRPDWNRTSFYVPNDYVFAVVNRHARSMIACPSINPNRADASDELSRCHSKGARLFKVHPPTQGVDVADAKHKPFFRLCAQLDMVMMVHTGHEHSAPVLNKDLANPRRLVPALDQGCTVVACHAGSGWETDQPDQLPEFLKLLKRYPKLWGDTAVLGTAPRVRDFRRLLGEGPAVRDRLLHGSDFPFPSVPAAFETVLGKETAERLTREGNWIKRDFDLKEALGVGLESARRAYRLAT